MTEKANRNKKVGKCDSCNGNVVFLFYRKYLDSKRRTWVKTKYLFCEKCNVINEVEN